MLSKQSPDGGTVGAVGRSSVAGIVSTADGGGFGPSMPTMAEQSTHKGIEAALREITTAETPEMFAGEFQRQIKVRNGYSPTPAAKYWDEATSNIQALWLYGTMKEGSNLIRLLWGFGKYYEYKETGDVSTEILGFAGDRDVYGNIPPMVS